ncbi:hypothetical protein K443DRAFT_80090, partial [Laccaria amethystina LaAM-08-1]
LHPSEHRLTKEISLWFNPFNELASIPSSLIQHQLFSSGRRQASHIHLSSNRLRPLFGHSPLPKLARCSEFLIPDALSVVSYMVYHPMAPVSVCYTSNHCLWTQIIRIHPQLVVTMGCHITHTDVPIADWAL